MAVNEPLTLYSLNKFVRSAINEAMPTSYWVTGELSEVRETTAGHCYIELIERDEKTAAIVAKARGTIWARTYSLLHPYFFEQTGRRFAAGLKVLLKVTVEFHELYGYSLYVCDIEPAFTLGDMARRRQMIIDRLVEEGVIDLNKELSFPILPQRVAVISSSYAAGYGDFCDQLINNPYGFVFYPSLFAAPMQGDKVESGIIAALDRIAESIDHWDVVVIIRGGGATSDLSCFDTYNLANNCAQFPLPIITGIGHHRDDTVLDSVAHTRVKTPTAAAELLIHTVARQAALIDTMSSNVVSAVRDRIAEQKMRLQAIEQRLPIASALLLRRQVVILDTLGGNIVSAVRERITEQKMRLQTIVQRLPIATALFLQNQHHKLDLWQQQAASASPQRILSLGYSLTTCGGRIVRGTADVKSGDTIVTHLADGTIISTVNDDK